MVVTEAFFMTLSIFNQSESVACLHALVQNDFLSYVICTHFLPPHFTSTWLSKCGQDIHITQPNTGNIMFVCGPFSFSFTKNIPGELIPVLFLVFQDYKVVLFLHVLEQACIQL